METKTIAVVTDTKTNFDNYVKEHGEQNVQYVHVKTGMDENTLSGIQFDKIIKSHGHDNVDKSMVQKAQQRMK